MMGGDIWIKSKLGKGSTFTFNAEFKRQIGKKENFLRIPSDLQKLRVLIVDDNENSRIIIRDILDSFYLENTLASSGREAITELEKSILENKPYRLIIMDWKMPEMDGIETTSLIRKSQFFSQIPIIMMTAYGREEVIHQAKNVEIGDFLIKPINVSVLFDTIINIFKPNDYLGKGEVKSNNDRQNLLQSCIQDQLDINIDSLKGARILLVEDHKINQQVAKELLESAEIIVDIANNGREAIEKIRNLNLECTNVHISTPTSHFYDAILMDIQMPEINGYEATKRIKNEELKSSKEISEIDNSHFSVPIIAMTAHAMAGEREKCLEAGMDDYITKPIDPDDLFSVLKKWIQKDNIQESNIQNKNSVSENITQQNKLKKIELQFTNAAKTTYPLNIEQGIKRVVGNIVLYKKLLSEFYEDYKNEADNILVLFKKGDIEESLKLAHTIKGVSSNMGAEALQQAAIELESGLKENMFHNSESIVSKFRFELNQLLEFIKTEIINDQKCKFSLKNSNESQNANFSESENIDNIEEVKNILDKMMKLFEDGDIEAEEYLKPLKQYINNSIYHPLLTRIEHQINNYDFDGATDTLAKIITQLQI